MRRLLLFGGAKGDPDALLWRATVVAAGGTVSAGRFALISLLIGTLKAAGVWTFLDRLLLLAAENAQSALICLRSRVSATAVNSPTFTVDQGYTFNGTTNYINTNFNPSTAANFTQNSAHYATYSRSAPLGGSAAMMGPMTLATDGLNTFNNAGGIYLRLNDNPATSNIGVTSDWIGFVAGNRSGATARQAYRNGAALGSYGSSPSQAPLNDNLALGAWPGHVLFNSFQGAAQSFGGSLTAGQHSTLYAAIQSYMTSVGAQV